MGKLGDYDYPEMKPTDAVEAIRLIESNVGKKANLESIASALGHKTTNSGPFRVKIADLNRYGLIIGRGEISLSPLAERILRPTDEQELQASLKEMIFKIPLLKDMYQELNGSQPNDNFWIQLQKVTKSDRATAQQKAEEISKLYIDAMSKIKEGNTMYSSTPNMPSHQSIPQSVASNLIELHAGELFLRLPKNKANIQLFITALQNLQKEDND